MKKEEKEEFKQFLMEEIVNNPARGGEVNYRSDAIKLTYWIAIKSAMIDVIVEGHKSYLHLNLEMFSQEKVVDIIFSIINKLV